MKLPLMPHLSLPLRFVFLFFGLLIKFQETFSFVLKANAASTNHEGRTVCFASATTSRRDAKAHVDSQSVMAYPGGPGSPVLESVIYPGVQASPRVWKNVCPGIFEDVRGVDVRLHWDIDQDSSASSLAERVASSMMAHIRQRIPGLSETEKMQDSLADSFNAFMTFCDDNLQGVEGYTARVVATRGPPSTKCPAWHQDHVPVRWIQSLYGPGCEWVDLQDWSTGTDEADAEDDSVLLNESVDDMNRRRVDPNEPIHQSCPGQAVMLVGRSWRRYCRNPALADLPAVIHKSPSGFLPWQGRVLLTIDVKTPNEP